jgi:hypothetical protein
VCIIQGEGGEDDVSVPLTVEPSYKEGIGNTTGGVGGGWGWGGGCRAWRVLFHGHACSYSSFVSLEAPCGKVEVNWLDPRSSDLHSGSIVSDNRHIMECDCGMTDPRGVGSALFL